MCGGEARVRVKVRVRVRVRFELSQGFDAPVMRELQQPPIELVCVRACVRACVCVVCVCVCECSCGMLLVPCVVSSVLYAGTVEWPRVCR